jgi:excisionase family DNA binding protein
MGRPSKPLFLSRHEACRELGVSLTTLDLAILRGEIPSVAIGPRRRVIPRKFLERLATASLKQVAVTAETATGIRVG